MAGGTIRRILHIAKMTGVAGTEKHLLILLPGLMARGLDVHLLILTEPGVPMSDYADRMTHLGVPTAQIPIHRDFDPALFARIRRHILSLAPDAVHTHLIHADLHGIVSARRAKVPLVFSTSHNDDPFRSRWSIRMLQGYLWPRLDRAIAISEAIRRHAIEVQGCPPQKIVTVHHGIEIPPPPPNVPGRPTVRYRLGLPADAIVFGSVCRLVEQKGLADALAAFALVAAQIPAAHYVIAGEGPLRGALETQAANLAGRVHFLGWRNDAPDLMPAFNALVMPSKWEGFGLVALEAMAAWLPIIATRSSALPEIVTDGVTGLLTPPGDITGLAAAMLAIARDPAKAREMGQNARRRVEEQFSAARMIDRTLEVYQNASPP